MDSNSFYASMAGMRADGGEYQKHADEMEQRFNALQRLKRKTSFSSLSGHEAEDLRNMLNFAENGIQRSRETGEHTSLKPEDIYSLKAELNHYPGVSVSLNSALAGKVSEVLKQAEFGIERSFLLEDFM